MNNNIENGFIKHFDLHGILTFQVIYPKEKNILSDYNFPYSYFEVENVENPSIILNIKPFDPDIKDCDVVFKKYFVKKNYIYCKDQEGLFSWKIEFKGIDDDITFVNFWWERLPPKALIAPYNFPQKSFIEPLIEYKLSKKGYCLLHSAAISNNKKATLMVGRSGASKTSIIAHCLNKLGYSYLGDDKVIIKNGMVFSFPRYIGIFNYLINNDYSKEMSGIFEKIKCIYFLIVKRNHSINFRIEDKSIIGNINVICKSKENTFPLITPLNKGSLIRSLINNNLAERQMDELNTNDLTIDSHFHNYLTAYSYVFPDLKYPSYKQTMYDIFVNSISDDINISEIIISENHSQGEFDLKIEEILKNCIL